MPADRPATTLPRIKQRRAPRRMELWGRAPGAADLTQIDDDSHTPEEQRAFARDYAAAGWSDFEFRPALPPSRQDVRDLALLVGSLAHALKRAKPESTLPARATDFLRRKGLQGSPLREAVPQ